MVKETWILAPLFDINPLNQICWYKFSEQNRFHRCKSDKNPLKYWKLKFSPREFFFEKKGNKFKFDIYPSTHWQTDKPTDRLNRSKKHIDKFTYEQGQIARGKCYQSFPTNSGKEQALIVPVWKSASVK